MEKVRQLVSLFYSRKGIVPLDEETLIQFAMQHGGYDGSLVEDIEAHFESALNVFTAKAEKKVLVQTTVSLEPSRDLTSDEKLLYAFFSDYCTRNKITGTWVADWQHVCGKCDEKISGLTKEYLQGKLGTISSMNRFLGGDRVLIDFRMYTSLDEKLRWDKFFCPGLSNEDLLRILVARHKQRHGNNPKLKNTDCALLRGSRISRGKLLELSSNISGKNLDESVCKTLMISGDLVYRIPAYKSIRVKCNVSEEADCISRNVYNVHVSGYQSFVMKSLDFRFVGTSNSCEIQFCVINDKREIRLGPAKIEQEVTLRGFMFCEKFFCVSFSQNVQPHDFSIHAEILENGFGRQDQTFKRIATSVRARPMNANSTSAGNVIPHTPLIRNPANRKKSRGVMRAQGNDSPGIAKSHNQNDFVPKHSEKTCQRYSARSTYTATATDISCIAEMFHESVSRARVCLDWLESGDCPIVNLCPYSHP